jgi:hypothetical protein
LRLSRFEITEKFFSGLIISTSSLGVGQKVLGFYPGVCALAGEEADLPPLAFGSGGVGRVVGP